MKSTLQQGVSREDICRVFLKTYYPFQQRFGELAEKARFREVAEGRFRERAARVGRAFFRLRPKYEPATRFLLADFDAGVDGRSLLFVLEGGRRISYAGILAPPKVGKPSKSDAA